MRERRLGANAAGRHRPLLRARRATLFTSAPPSLACFPIPASSTSALFRSSSSSSSLFFLLLLIFVFPFPSLSFPSISSLLSFSPVFVRLENVGSQMLPIQLVGLTCSEIFINVYAQHTHTHTHTLWLQIPPIKKETIISIKIATSCYISREKLGHSF
jgi:hypothetical protein